MPNKVKTPKSDNQDSRDSFSMWQANFIYKVQIQNRQSPVLHRACCQDCTSLVLWFVEAVSQAALPAVVTVKVAGHEHPGSTLVCRTLAAQPVDLAILINLRIKTDIVKPHQRLPKLNTEHMQLAKNRMNIADK